MSDEKPKPVDDLKQGLNLLFRAAKNAVDGLPTSQGRSRVETAVKDGAKEVGRAFENVANELDKAFSKMTGSQRPPSETPHTGSGSESDPRRQEPKATEESADVDRRPHADEAGKAAAAKPFDDAYAPAPPPSGKGGPRVG